MGLCVLALVGVCLVVCVRLCGPGWVYVWACSSVEVHVWGSGAVCVGCVVGVEKKGL